MKKKMSFEINIDAEGNFSSEKDIDNILLWDSPSIINKLRKKIKNDNQK